MEQPSRVIDLDDFFESAEQACVALGVSHATLYKRIARGELQTIRFAGKQLIVKPEKANEQ